MADSLPETQYPASSLDDEPSASDYDLLKQAIFNEKTAPEILQYETELVVRLENQVASQEEEIERLDSEMELELPKLLFNHELQRVKYMLKSYYRTRLQKLSFRFNVAYALDSDEVLQRLSEKEKTFAEEYFIALAAYVRDTTLSQLPDFAASMVKSSTSEIEKDIIPQPNLDQHVFCRVLQDCGNIVLDDEGNTVSLEAGDLVVTRYRPVSQLLAEGAVCLV